MTLKPELERGSEIIGQRWRIFPGWWIVISGAAIQMMISGLIYQLYGAYVVLLEREFEWSKTALSAVYSVFRVESGLLGPPHDWLVERCGLRRVMQAGVILIGLAFLALSRVDRLGAFLACFLVIALGSSLCGHLSICIAIVNWFHRRKARALSIASMGSAVGGFIVPAAVLALQAWGWRTVAMATGVLFLTAGLLLTSRFRGHPEEMGCTIDGEPVDGKGDANGLGAEERYTLREAISSRAFWTLSVGHASALVIVAAVSVHLIPHLTETLHFTLAQAGLAVMAMTTMQFAGLALGGYLGDRIDMRKMAIGCMFMHGAGILCLALATGWIQIAAFAALHGLAWGGRGPLMQAIRAEYFGRRSYGMIVGYSSVIVTLGTSGGPLLAAGIVDHFGSYRYSFMAVAAFALIGAAMFWLARPPRRA